MAGAVKMPWLSAYPPEIKWDLDLPAGTMTALFDEAVKRHADKTCLRFLGRSTTYDDVGRAVARFAKGLQNIGAKKGDRVGLCLPNTPFYVIAYHGILKAGATAVNFNPLYAEKEIEEQITDSGITIMVTLNVTAVQPKIEKMLGRTGLKKIIFCELADALPPVKGRAFTILNTLKGYKDAPRTRQDAAHIDFATLTDNDGKFAPVEISPDDVAVLQYTGGTTGIPKAAQLTQGNLSVNTRQAAIWFTGGKAAPEKQARMLAVLPFFHVFSMTVQMNLTLHAGGVLIMLPRFELKMLLKTIDAEKPTIFAGVPTLYRAICTAPDVKQYDLSSLELCVSGGAPLPDNIRADFKKLTGLDLVEGYGLSETSPLTHGNPIFGVKKSGSIGLPVPRTEVRIVDLETGEVAKPLSEGEIRIRGPQVMKGYWNRPGETAHVMDEDGFLRTGDVGYIDADGYTFIVDRIKDMIIASGFKVFPRRVEEAVMQHPAVGEVLVAGIKDEYRGETVKAWVVKKPGADVSTEALVEFLKDKLAPYEMPKAVEFRDALPKTLIGKPDRKALVAQEALKDIKER